MKNKLICIVLSLTLLTGCSGTNEVLLSYSTNMDSLPINNSYYESSGTADFFADDLVIIRDSSNHMSDSLITASSALIVNQTDNEVIFSNNVYEVLYPASLTKLLTALVVLEYGDLTDTVTVSYNASNIKESGAKLSGFREGDKVNLGDLLSVFLIFSGNDAGIAIAEHIGGTEAGFAKMMNDMAKKVGAVHSNFVNAHGLHDDEQYTTAYDLYLIFNELLNYDKFISIINQSSVTINHEDSLNRTIKKEFSTTNRYIKGTEKTPDGITVIGGKTGTTSKAGNCLVLLSKDNNDKSYISVIMKAENGNSLFNQMTHLLKMITE